MSLKRLSKSVLYLNAQVNYPKLAIRLNHGETIETLAKEFGVTEERMIRKLWNMGFRKRGSKWVYVYIFD